MFLVFFHIFDDSYATFHIFDDPHASFTPHFPTLDQSLYAPSVDPL